MRDNGFTCYFDGFCSNESMKGKYSRKFWKTPETYIIIMNKLFFLI